MTNQPESAEPTLGAELGASAKELGGEILSTVWETILGYLAWGVLLSGMFLAVIAPAIGLVAGVIALVIAFVRGASKIFSAAVVVLSAVMWISSGSALGMLPALLSL